MQDGMQIQEGALLTPLLVTDLTVSGGAVARYEGRVVFLDRALLGDVVSAEIVAVKKRVIEAKVKEVLSISPYAVRPWCPHFEACGGCLWQDLSYEASLEWKQRHVQETLIRIGRLEGISVLPVAASPHLREFRNKLTFAFGQQGGKTVLGLRQRSSHEIVEVTDCGLQSSRTMDVLALARDFLQAHPLPAYEAREGYLRFFVVRNPEQAVEGQRPLHVEIITAPSGNGNAEYSEHIRSFAQHLLDSPLGVAGVVHSERKNAAPIAEGEKIVFALGASTYTETIGQMQLELPVGAFLQTNTGAASLLYSCVAEAAQLTGSETVWDVYCGAGGIGLSLGMRAGKIAGFDIQPPSVAAAVKNAERLGYAHAAFYAGNLPACFSQEPQQPDVIILDPPRAGVAPDVLAFLSQTAARRIVYVSCDVATQARDLARLSAQWEPKYAAPIDMFPYTPHVENVVLLERKH